MGQSDTKWLKMTGEMTDHLGPYSASGWKAIGLVGKRRHSLPVAEIIHEPSNKIVLELGAVDHLDADAVRDCV